MSQSDDLEKATQRRVIKLFEQQLGYRFLGSRQGRSDNSNIDEALLTAWLTSQGHNAAQISRAIHLLKVEADSQGRDLYYTNQAVYEKLRYGVAVKTEAGQVTETVNLVNWQTPEKNDFVIVEEVTLRGGLERRPDLVLYLNGIAVAVIELKCGSEGIGKAMRQLISNQSREFNEWFFSTVQLCLAGNDSEGLRYGTTGTPEKYYLTWKEDEDDNSGYKLDKYLAKLCSKQRLLELMHDFVLFDGGVKKVPRVHQYFGIKEAQQHVQRREGGIIWHTQGSGKSIVMVLLAKWILENNPNARIVVVTDRDELDKQIEKVLKATRAVPTDDKVRASSGRDLMAKLSKAKPRLICSLIHKFGLRDVDDFDAFIADLESGPSKTVGEVYVFVDECHRTQSGRLHRAMRAMMPNAVFIGFTGTPLLKKDKATTLEVFGRYIHTYKFSEAVDDKVVLDLVYEARDIDQRLSSKDKVDAWFEARTRALNSWQKDELKKHWGTMQRVLSSKSRMSKVVADILFDFSTKSRLSSERGNAILVARNIHEACRYYELFRQSELKNRCAVVTSYNPEAKDVASEDTGADTETDKEFIYATYTRLLKGVVKQADKSKTETYEDEVKNRFTEDPAQMKLLIVVDKLLTGYDAPPCSYLYIDKSMQDHGLFQAICRTNRLDGEDKDFGYIVDYKDLFKKVENAIAVYSSDELDHSAGGAAPEVLLQDRLKAGKERLDTALEKISLLCEPVEPPKENLQYIHYFCGNTEIPTDLADHEPQREALYKATASLVRAYANLADEIPAAGYSPEERNEIEAQVITCVKRRETIRKASGESLDLKAYEADMRHLIDTYIEADDPRKISPFDDLSLIELIVKSGIADAIAKRLNHLSAKDGSVAETIENNVRSKIIREHLNDPSFYDKMSSLLAEVIRDRKTKAIAYEEYLKKIAELVEQVEAGHDDKTPAPLKKSAALRALYNNLQNASTGGRGYGGEAAAEYTDSPYSSDPKLALAIEIDKTVRAVKPDAFRGNQAKENTIKQALLPLLNGDVDEVNRIFEIVVQQSDY